MLHSSSASAEVDSAGVKTAAVESVRPAARAVESFIIESSHCSTSIGNLSLTCREGNLVTRRWSVRDRRHIGECDRWRQWRAGATRGRVNDLARRQGPAMPQMLVHQVHRLEEVAVQRDII